jgi:serine/threonine-protein kinase
MIGKTLGNYQVIEKIGAGGMGEVYRARDTRLNRDVALKVLPPAFANDPERMVRFQREAQMLALLNHPNIAAIYGLEESEGQPYLVLEHVPGATLQGPLPAAEAMELATQIAAALEEAHSKGIIHRDLKPANIKITPEGKVKVLDFGLAKAFGDDGSDGDPMRSPTLSALATRMGTILGTASYMSPEQARGKALDKRTDVWSFGCVLYELLTGSRLSAATT